MPSSDSDSPDPYQPPTPETGSNQPNSGGGYPPPDPRFVPPPGQYPPPTASSFNPPAGQAPSGGGNYGPPTGPGFTKPKSRGKGCLIAFGIVGAVLLVALVVFGFFGYKIFKEIGEPIIGATGFMEAVKDEDYDRATDFVGESCDSPPTADDISQLFPSPVEDFTISTDGFTVEDNEVEDNETAGVPIDIEATLENGDKASVEIELGEGDDRSKVCEVSVS